MVRFDLVSCTNKCLNVCNCFKDRLSDGQSCLNLYPCVMKFSQSVSQSLSLCVSVYLSLTLCVSLRLCMCVRVGVSVYDMSVAPVSTEFEVVFDSVTVLCSYV